MIVRALLAALYIALSPVAFAAAEPGLPLLAAPGPDKVGTIVRTVTLPDAFDPFASMAQGHAVRAPRTLALRVWYPARRDAKGRPVTYAASLTSEPPLPPARFIIPGTAIAGAKAAGQGYPVVVVSHGYDNDPAMLRWLGENLATKGYVVVAIAHCDPPITDPKGSLPLLLRRPQDVVAVLHRLRGGLLGPLVDTTRIALAGYSFGGYSVLTVAGARLDLASPMVSRLPTPLVAAYAGDGPSAAELHDMGVKAVVAIAPAGGAPWSAWGDGLRAVHAPLLFIGGTADRLVGYDAGPARLFEQARGADRLMLTFLGAGHSIGTDPAPPQMRGRMWDFDWFEDAVWRKERVNGISLHFITAFLDLHLKGEVAKAEYLTVPSPQSDGAGWTGSAAPYAAVSEGGDNPTWKGFVRNHQNGLILRHLSPDP